MLLIIAWVLCGILAVLLIVASIYVTKIEKENEDENGH